MIDDYRRKGIKAMTKLADYIQKSIYIFFIVIICLILLVTIFFQNLNYMCRKEFLFSNIVLLIIALLFLLFVSVLLTIKNYTQTHQMIHPYKAVNIASICLFIFLLYISLNIYFLSGWDVGKIISDAKNIINGERIEYETYYSQFPNQQLLLFLESVLFKIHQKFGVIDIKNGLMVLIAFQCILYCITGNVLYRILFDYLDSVFFAWLGYLLFCLLLAVSGWVTIPYTDGMSIFFPILILRCYQKIEHGTAHKILWWISIGILSYWGFKMKPTVLIVLIAIVLTEIINIISDFSREKIKNISMITAVLFICFLFSIPIFQIAIHSTGININKELDTGALHMIMLGLNNERDGFWNEADVNLSTNITNKTERKKAQMNIIMHRLNEYGLIGLLRHTARKTLVNFNDGSFAWGVEGGFYTQIYKEKNSVTSPFFRDLFYNDGNAYRTLSTIEQATWLGILFFSGCCIFLKREKIFMVSVLSLLGIIIFVTIFEARARYLMIYVPIFIMVAVVNLKSISSYTYAKLQELKH